MFNQHFVKKFLFHHESQCNSLILGLDPTRSCMQAGTSPEFSWRLGASDEFLKSIFTRLELKPFSSGSHRTFLTLLETSALFDTTLLWKGCPYRGAANPNRQEENRNSLECHPLPHFSSKGFQRLASLFALVKLVTDEQLLIKVLLVTYQNKYSHCYVGLYSHFLFVYI